jgi:hypothetical protein
MIVRRGESPDDLLLLVLWTPLNWVVVEERERGKGPFFPLSFGFPREEAGMAALDFEREQRKHYAEEAGTSRG